MVCNDMFLPDIISLTIDDKYMVIYRKDESVKDWRIGERHLVHLKDIVKLCHMLSTLTLYCHMANIIIGNITINQLELGFDTQVFHKNEIPHW